jgi:DNA-damage-inducible protein J
MDSEIMQGLGKFCAEAGLSRAAAINLFARMVVREQRLPFEIATFAREPDPFYSAANQEFLRESIAQLDRGEGRTFAMEALQEAIKDADAGKLTEHELIEA